MAPIPEGLSESQARARLAATGPNELPAAEAQGLARRVAGRLANPLLLTLLGASGIAALTGDALSFGIVFVVVVASLVLDLAQQQRADRVVQSLQQRIALRAAVWRDGRLAERPARELVPGDVVQLAAGDLVPADGTVLQAQDCFVNQAMFTGEAAPERKLPPATPADTEGLDAPGRLLGGSSVVSGSARMRVDATGAATELGRMTGTLQRPEPTEFERASRRFGLLLMRWTVALVLAVLLLNVLYHRPLLESFLFAVALAVGLTPELLPMIVSVTLARGAMRLAGRQVVVRRLSAIEDLGAMDVLCTDKTGTLTEAAVRVEQALDPHGAPSGHVLDLAALNSRHETGVRSVLDEAILQARPAADHRWHKLDEVPFDFERRRVSVLLQHDGARLLVCKGAPEELLARCVAWRDGDQARPLDARARERILGVLGAQAAQGLRLLGVAYRDVAAEVVDVGAADERDFVFAGFVAFADPPKAGVAEVLRQLHGHGVRLKVLTGDNEAVTRHLCAVIGLNAERVLTGAQVAALDDHGLRAAVRRHEVFCRVSPQQKNRIVQALKAGGHVVGYLGDGANDAPPLHSADVGISVDQAVDVARQAADLVLLQHDLAVLLDGVREGRRTVVNVNKYVFMATSSNFGNMVSMAVAALALPFLPMRPAQVLLNNLLYDVSELALPLDRVHGDAMRRPQRFDIARVRRFMLWFGPLSSAFDLAAFALLLKVAHAGEATFQTAWFVQSLATQVLVVFVVRTSAPAWRDLPSRAVAWSAIGTCAAAVALPYTALGPVFGFVPLPAPVLAMVAGLTAGYLAAVELFKRRFKVMRQRPSRRT